jgi:hypothetical protein
MAAFCGLSPPMNAVKKNVPTGRLGGGRGAVVKPSQREISMAYYNILSDGLVDNS